MLKQVLIIFNLCFLLFIEISAQSIWVTQDSLPTDENLYSITWNGNLFVAVGRRETILTSLDGENWNETYWPDGVPRSLTSYFRDVTWTGSQFVVVGKDSIITSPDGVSWTGRSWYLDPDWLYSIVWNGSKLVAVGQNGVVGISSDGITWSKNYVDSTVFLYDVIWVKDQFIASGYYGTILTSTDGTNWTKQYINTNQHISDLAWTGNLIVAVGASGIIYTSPDGANWTRRSSDIPDSLHFECVEWTGVQVIAVGTNGKILTSPDGIDWTYRVSNVETTLRAITSSGNKIVVVGNDGMLLTSERDSTTYIETIKSQRTDQRTKSNLLIHLSEQQITACLLMFSPSKNIDVTIYTLSGKKLYQKVDASFSGQITFPIRSYASGHYLLHVKHDENRYTKNFNIVR